MRFIRREKLPIAVAILILSVTFYYSFFYKPLYDEISTTRYNLECNEQKLSALAIQKDELLLLKAQLPSTILEVEPQIPNAGEKHFQSMVIVFLEDIIKKLGIENSIKFEGSEQHEIFSIINMRIGLESSYENLIAILYSIQGAPWPNKVKNVQTVSSSSRFGTPSNNWSIEIRVDFYWFPDSNQ